jgi:thymidylate synthase
MVEVKKPIINFNQVVDEELQLIGLNLDLNIHNKFKTFKFKNGKNGKWWIEDRINEMFTGLYHKGISSYNQFEFVKDTLKKIKTKKYTWCSNRLLCITFNPIEKKLNHTHLSRTPTPPCLTLLDFKPEQNNLHLIATWRAQFFDTKAYGNLISLAMLLKKVCEETGFSPGRLISIANKAILKYLEEKVKLLKELKS